MSVINLNAEPQGTTYLALLDFAAQHCTSFSLTWRDAITYHDTAVAIEIELHPMLLGELLTDGWENGRQHGTARVRSYKISDQSLSVLSRVEKLYAWRGPKLPEDLSFYKDRDCWMVSVSREGYAFFDDASLTAEDLRLHVPGIEI